MRTLNSAADEDMKEKPPHLIASNSQASRIFNRKFGGHGARGDALSNSISVINDQKGFAALGINRNL